jgi:hypothetical protein
VSDDDTADASRLGTARQPIVKAAGRARRAKLMPAPDTDPSPLISTGSTPVPVLREDGGVASVPAPVGANDARLRQDRPPHW